MQRIYQAFFLVNKVRHSGKLKIPIAKFDLAKAKMLGSMGINMGLG